LRVQAIQPRVNSNQLGAAGNWDLLDAKKFRWAETLAKLIR
jgi:hypothetical protein